MIKRVLGAIIAVGVALSSVSAFAAYQSEPFRTLPVIKPGPQVDPNYVRQLLPDVRHILPVKPQPKPQPPIKPVKPGPFYKLY
jgi:hypothetical protein